MTNHCVSLGKGRTRGGRPFTKTSLYRLLTNVAYAGKVRYKDEVHPGEQPALIDADTFGRVLTHAAPAATCASTREDNRSPQAG
jgi:hypothetical protein